MQATLLCQRRKFLAGSLLAASCNALGASPPMQSVSREAAPKGNPAGKGIHELNPPEMVLPILQNMQMRAIKAPHHGSPLFQQKQLTLLHFADIHNDVNNLRRVMDFARRYRPYIADILLTGDIAGGNWNSWSDDMMTVPDFHGVLKTLGNHDIYKWNRTARDATSSECYGKYFVGIESWGVTQPNGNNPGRLCYWHKDYSACGIRLIGLDCMHYDDAQHSWFADVLKGARSKGLAVIVAQHYPPAEEKDCTGLPNCPFDSLQRESMCDSSPRAVMAVDGFQKSGGEFVCWLCGHTHTDFCGTVNGKKQLFITVGTARNFEHWCDSRRVTGEKSQDLFNIISIDTYQKHIRIFRVGAEWNRYLQHRVTMCIDYAALRQVS